MQQTVGRIEIAVFADGNVAVKAEVPGGHIGTLGALEYAKVALVNAWQKQTQQAIQVAPAALLGQLNGRGE